jgi:HSP20 family molecular chaperone IbpA
MAVDTAKIKATYRDGVLTVKLPKSEEIKAKEIKVEA